MDYSSLYFEKILNNLEYCDIIDFFIEAKEESTRLEFKSFSARLGNFNKNYKYRIELRIA